MTTVQLVGLAGGIAGILGVAYTLISNAFRGSQASGAEKKELADLVIGFDGHTTAMGEFAKFMAKQEIINSAQGQVNALRESRENELGQRISRIEGQHERESKR